MGNLRKIICIGLLLIVNGCKTPWRGEIEETVFRRSQELFELYLTSDAAKARAVLTQEIDMLENAYISHAKERRATILFMECARLYALEMRLGNEDSARLALLKANYWNLRRYELNAVHGNIALEEWKLFTPEKLIHLVESSDKYHTNANGPQFYRNP
jgi:hypothetical protein